VPCISSAVPARLALVPAAQIAHIVRHASIAAAESFAVPVYFAGEACVSGEVSSGEVLRGKRLIYIDNSDSRTAVLRTSWCLRVSVQQC